MADETNSASPEAVTAQANAAAAADAVREGNPSAPKSARAPNDATKAWVRANIRWVMAELDWARSGRSLEEREQLNP